METLERVDEARRRLVFHDLYKSLDTPAAVRVFMETHVFAVWDFMSLLKRLQRELTCADVPWRPRLPDAETRFARFINEIVLAEETDDDGRGGYISHFGLYLEAMRECGARTGAIERFLGALDEGAAPNAALAAAGAPAGAATFVRETLDVALNGRPHEVCAAFFYGREELIPEMFAALLGELGPAAPRLRYYLARHVEIDAGEHGPLAARLLEHLCAGDPARIREAEAVALRALAARRALWDSILAQLAAAPAFAPRTARRAA